MFTTFHFSYGFYSSNARPNTHTRVTQGAQPFPAPHRAAPPERPPPYHTFDPHTCTLHRRVPCPGCPVPLHDPPSPSPLSPRPSPLSLRPSQACIMPLTSLPFPSPHTCTTTGVPMASPIAAHAHAHSTPRGGVSLRVVRAPLVRCARSRRARGGGACRVRGWCSCAAGGHRQAAGAGRLSPAARAPRRGRSAPCAS